MQGAPQMLSHGEGFVIYSVIDFVVDQYFPVLHQLESEVDALEDSVFSPNSARLDVPRVFELRHDLLMRRAVLPLQEVCSNLIRFDVKLIGPENASIFPRRRRSRHSRSGEYRQHERPPKGSARGQPAACLVQQNDVTKRLAAWAA